jgi:peptide deformylase
MEMKMVNILRAFLLFIAFVSVFSCASAPVGEKEDANPGLLTNAELEYINSESQDEAMRVFKNNSTSDDDVLRAKSLPALMFSKGYNVLEKRMMAALIEEKGVGIAAPQVGINRRVIYVQRLDKEDEPFEIYYNPLITEKRGEMEEGWEGCLSVPDGFGKVMRWLDITVEYDKAEADEKTVRFSENISGYTAIIFQHEIDHLDGVLFVDKETTGELIPKDEYRRMREEQKALELKKEED